MRMTLVGQYDSPYTRRVAVSLGLLGFASSRTRARCSPISNSMRGTNPLGRVPSLILSDGTTLIDFRRDPRLARSAGRAGPRSAAGKWPGAAGGAAAHRARHRHDRQGHGRGLRAFRSPRALPLGRLGRALPNPGRRRPPRAGGTVWPADAPVRQDWITAACMMRYVRLAAPDLLPIGRYPTLDAVADRCEAMPAFKATWPADYVVPAAGP